MRQLFCLMGMCLLHISTSAQSILDDFKKLNKHYAELTAYSMNFELRYVRAGEGNVSVQQGKVLHTSDIHYTELEGNITLINKGEFVSVNSSAKLLVYNKTDYKKDKSENETVNISDMLDSLWANQQGLTCKYLTAEEGKRRVYVADKNNEYYSAYEITMDINKYRLLEFVYYLRPEQNNHIDKIIITYSNETAKPKTTLDCYKPGYYVTTSGGKKKPTELYKEYEFIDQTKIAYEGN